MSAPSILFVNQSGVYGGAEFGLVDVAKHYKDRCEVVLFTDGPVRRDLEAAGVRVEILPLKQLGAIKRESRTPPVGALLDLWRLARAIAKKARSFDLIYANSQKAFTVAVIASYLARRPLIWHLRDILSPDHFSRANIKVAVFLANRRATRVLANSHATADAFVASGGSNKKVHAVPYGIAAEPFLAVTDADTRAARASLGVGAEMPLVGLFGRLAEWKGQHVAIAAVAELPGVHLMLVGKAMFGEDAYTDALVEQVKDLGIADRVHFVGFRNDIPTLMRSADVVAHTSVAAEPFGRVILEGMLAGRPVVATAAGGAREIVEDGVTGFLIPPSDTKALAAALKALLNDAGRRTAMGRAAQARALTHFTPQAMLDSIDMHVNAVVNTGAGARPQ